MSENVKQSVENAKHSRRRNRYHRAVPHPMKLGTCINPLDTLAWPSVPGDFLEANVQSLLMPEAPDADFAPVAAKVGALRAPILAANCFLPAALKVTGPVVDRDRLARYADTAFRRAAALGIEFIVFGSGGARQVPEGWPLAEGFEQFVQTLCLFAPLAQRHRVVLVVEPLNRAECNLVNTVLEGAVAVARVNHPAVRLLADFYHMLRNNESPDDLVKVGPWLAHAHIAEKAERTAPGVKGDDFRPFLAALRRARYSGALSLECKFGLDPRTEAESAFAFLRGQS